MSEFIARNWGWLTFVLIASPIVTIVGWMWLRAWQLSLGAWAKGVHLGIVDILLMRVRNIDTILLVNQLVVAKQNSLSIDTNALSAHMLAGGNIRRVIAAMVSAKRFTIPLTLERACAVDLVGQDPLVLIADTIHEVGKIPAPHDDKGGTSERKQLVNPAGVLLQATTGTKGTIIDSPTLTARVRFPQGELDVVVRSATVPKTGDSVLVTNIDGITITVEPSRN